MGEYQDEGVDSEPAWLLVAGAVHHKRRYLVREIEWRRVVAACRGLCLTCLLDHHDGTHEGTS